METVEEEDCYDGVDQESKDQGDVEGILADPDYFFNLQLNTLLAWHCMKLLCIYSCRNQSL